MSVEMLNVDCMEYMKSCKDKQFDLAITDPPYFSGPEKLGFYGASVSSTNVVRKGYEKIGLWDKPEQDYFDELKRVSKNQIIWGINYYDINNLGTGRIVWDKVNGQSSFSDCEIAYCSLHDSVRMFSYMWNGFMQGVSVENGKKAIGNKKLNETRIHPTQKPVKLYEWLLTNYAKPGQAILDTHLGSGSSAIASHYFDVNFVGCELDKTYFEAAKKRIDEFTRQKSMFNQAVRLRTSNKGIGK